LVPASHALVFLAQLASGEVSRAVMRGRFEPLISISDRGSAAS